MQVFLITTISSIAIVGLLYLAYQKFSHSKIGVKAKQVVQEKSLDAIFSLPVHQQSLLANKETIELVGKKSQLLDKSIRKMYIDLTHSRKHINNVFQDCGSAYCANIAFISIHAHRRKTREMAKYLHTRFTELKLSNK